MEEGAGDTSKTHKNLIYDLIIVQKMSVYPYEKNRGGGKMAEQVKALAVKSDDLSSVSGTLLLEGVKNSHKKNDQCQEVMGTPLVPALGRQRQMDLRV